jgi:predicted outer membrane repeat protein
MADALLPQVGSPDGGCKPKIQLNTFQNNRAKLTGGAIFFTYCNKATPFVSTNKFIGNKAGTFNGQIGYNPITKPKEQGGGSTGRAGCGKPTNFKNTFSGSGTVSYGKPWYFP